jgi:hypothetical protein
MRLRIASALPEPIAEVVARREPSEVSA